MPINCHIAARRVAVRADWSPMLIRSPKSSGRLKKRGKGREHVKTRKRETDVFLA